MNKLLINICETGNLEELKKIVKILLNKDIDEMINFMELELENIEKNNFCDYNIYVNESYYNYKGNKLLKDNINSCITYLKKIK